MTKIDKIEKLEDIEIIVKCNADKFLKQLNKVVEELEELEHTEIEVETFQKQPEKQEEWSFELRKLMFYDRTQFAEASFYKPYIGEYQEKAVDFISQLLSEKTKEAKIQQLREDIEQVEVFLPEKISDTPEYWIPTQILLELEKDLSKLLKEKE